MMVAVLSDTHGQVSYTLEAARVWAPFEPALALHCGDIGSPRVVSAIAPLPTHYVLGNVDVFELQHELEDAIAAAGQTCHGRFGEVDIAGRRVALLHGDDEQRLADAIQSQQYDLVCHGHTHRQRLETVGRTVVLNPGALYRAFPHSIAMVEFPALTVTHLRV